MASQWPSHFVVDATCQIRRPKATQTVGLTTLTDFYSEDSLNVRGNDIDKGTSRCKLLYLKEISIQEISWNQLPSTTDKHIAGKLSLCIGLPVIILYNFATELCITKGQEGYVYGWQSIVGSKKQHILDTLFVKLKNPSSPVQFDGLPENVVPITASTKMVKAALLRDTAVQISRTQVGVLPNYFMTHYASQGKTCPNNIVNLNYLLTHQSYYTALSRSATAQGTIILQGFNPHKITGYASGALCQEFCELELQIWFHDGITLQHSMRYVGHRIVPKYILSK